MLTKQGVWKGKVYIYAFSLKKGRSDMASYLEMYYIALTLYETWLLLDKYCITI